MVKAEDLKAKLMAEAERRINKIISEKSEGHEISLQEIEKTAIEAGQGFREAVQQELVDEAGHASRDQSGVCPDCGKSLHNKGLRSKQVVSTAGEFTVRRAYYYCPDCQQGFFPLG